MALNRQLVSSGRHSSLTIVVKFNDALCNIEVGTESVGIIWAITLVSNSDTELKNEYCL